MRLGEGGRVVITIPEALRDKLGPEGARALAELLNETSVHTREDVIQIAADRFERRLAEESAKVRAEIGALRTECMSEIGKLRTEFMSEFGRLRTESISETGKLRAESLSEIGKLRADMGSFEGRITRWMFVFWIGQIGALLGILFAFFRS